MCEDNIKEAIESEIRFFKRMSELVSEKQRLLNITDKEPYEILRAPIHTSSSCSTCGESPTFKTEDQGETFFAETECLYSGGFPPIEVLLEVPSGEILLFNDLRRSYEKAPNHININSTQGIKQHTEHYAKQGLITHFVGNSSPRVFQMSADRLEIRGGYCEKEDGCTLPECPMPSCGQGTQIGSICTDLWWYCAVDRAAFEKRIGKTAEQYEKEYHATGAWPEIVHAKVIPGTYRTVSQYHIDSEKLYSFIERVK
jgi:hypothetical protein